LSIMGNQQAVSILHFLTLDECSNLFILQRERNNANDQQW
jgi:hypothetical protein